MEIQRNPSNGNVIVKPVTQFKAAVIGETSVFVAIEYLADELRTTAQVQLNLTTKQAQALAEELTNAVRMILRPEKGRTN